MRSLHTATRESPCLLPLEKAPTATKSQRSHKKHTYLKKKKWAELCPPPDSYVEALKPQYLRCVLGAQLCPTVTPMDCSPPGSSVHGILRARALE